MPSCWLSTWTSPSQLRISVRVDSGMIRNKRLSASWQRAGSTALMRVWVGCASSRMSPITYSPTSPAARRAAQQRRQVQHRQRSFHLAVQTQRHSRVLPVCPKVWQPPDYPGTLGLWRLPPLRLQPTA